MRKNKWKRTWLCLLVAVLLFASANASFAFADADPRILSGNTKRAEECDTEAAESTQGSEGDGNAAGIDVSGNSAGTEANGSSAGSDASGSAAGTEAAENATGTDAAGSAADTDTAGNAADTDAAESTTDTGAAGNAADTEAPGNNAGSDVTGSNADTENDSCTDSEGTGSNAGTENEKGADADRSENNTDTESPGSAAGSEKDTDSDGTGNNAETEDTGEAENAADTGKAESSGSTEPAGTNEKAETLKGSSNDKKESEEEDVVKEEFPKTYEYEDDTVVITAIVNEAGVIDENARFVCSKIDEKSDEYNDIRAKLASFYGITEDLIDIFPYNVSFMIGKKESEPEYGFVTLEFSFKEPIEVDEGEAVEIIHLKNGEAPQVLTDDVVTNGAVETFEVDMDSFSPVVIAKTNINSMQLKSVPKTDENGHEYYISRTANIGENGVATASYANNANVTDTVSCSGALYLDVVLSYGSYNISNDWLYIKDENGTVFTQDADGQRVGSASQAGKIGGANLDMSGSTTSRSPSQTVRYRFDTDTLQFTWKTDASNQGYGYYAVITPTYPTTAIPDYHFEELEDGTYALVFDRGGNIEAFTSRKELKEAIAPYKDKISEIRLHKDTKAVDSGAFKDLSSLQRVTMPRNGRLDTIGRNAFAGCDNLESFTVPDTVTDIDPSAFSGCAALTTFNFASGNTMTELPDAMFKGLSSLKNVNLPSGLTEIPKDCFYNCTSLKNIDIPSGVTAIKENAFRNTRLSEVFDLSNIRTIENMAFAENPSLTEVSIPANVTSLGDAFRGCTGITDFVFEDGTSFQTLLTDFFQGMTKLKNVKLPGNLTEISNEMFKGCSSLEYVDLPEDVEKIGNNAFESCTKLQDFEIPPKIHSIGTSAFRYCSSLKDMTIPNTVRNIGTELFYGCSNLLRVRFEEGSPITTLPTGMFYGCDKLENFTFPDGVSAIPNYFFQNCSSLKHIDLPENLTSIGSYAFSGCKRLEVTELPSSLNTINERAFYGCESITNVVIPRSVRTIGSYAFRNCSALRSFVCEEESLLTSLGTYMFYQCTNLENLVLPSGLSSIPNHLARYCSKLEHVDIPPNVTSIGTYAFDGCTKLDNVILPEKCTQIYNYAFRNSGLTHIELPSKTQSVGNYAFYNTGITSVSIPKATTSIGNYAFSSNSQLESVEFEEGGNDVKVQQQGFANCPQLKEFITNGRITYIGQGMLMNDRRLEEYVIDPKVTEVRGQAFYNDIGLKRLEIKASPTNTALKVDNETSSSNYNFTFGNLASLEEFIIDRDITSSYVRDKELYTLNPNVHITIGKNVNNLDNMIVSAFTSDTELTFEGENDFTVTTRVANKSQDAKWSELKGDFYVDEHGVVYKLNKSDNTASLFYIPKGITEYTVPASVTSVAGQTYTVNKVESYTVRSAEDLTSLVFTDPFAVTIPQFSFSGCNTLRTINGKTELNPAEWASVSWMCDFPVQSEEESEQLLSIHDEINTGDDDKEFSFDVTISGQQKMDDDNTLTYVYPTGLSARLDFVISNGDNVDMSDRVVRIYFAFDGDNYTLGNYVPGNYTLVNTSTGVRYSFKVCKTDAIGVYYYDIRGFKPGDTLAFNNNFSYTSPKSGGGDMIVWAESISAEEAEEREGKTSQPNKYIKAHWYTTPTPYDLTKSVLDNPKFVYTSNEGDENDENIYVKNIRYRIQLNSTGASGSNTAKDYIKYIDMYDDLQLTEHMVWNPKFISAVQNGDFYYSFSGNTAYLYVKADGKWTELCHITFNDSSLVRNVYPEVVVDKNGNNAIRICWSYRNTYQPETASSDASADLPATKYDMYIGSQAIQIKQGSDLWRMFREGEEYPEDESQEMQEIANKVHETSHYSYSGDQELDAETGLRLVSMDSGFEMKKIGTNTTLPFGFEHGYDIKMINSGLEYIDYIDLVTDTLKEHYYIKADDMETMFSDSKWGPFLRIDMASLTLCQLPQKQAIDVYGSSFTITDAQYSGIDPIPYNGCAQKGTDSSEITTSARFSIYWDDTYTHKKLEVKDAAGDIQRTYMIGVDRDFATLDEAFKSLGFVVTYPAQYTVTWDLDDKYTLYHAHKDGVTVENVGELTPDQLLKYEYRLKSGRTDTIHIYSSTKRTDMFLENDKPTRYSYTNIYSNNTAYIKDNTGQHVDIAADWSGYIRDELSLSKSAFANGQSWTQNMKIPDDTVIDYTLSFTNSGDKYDVLPLSDKMGGSQVLLVPVRTNKNALYFANGSEEEVALQNAGLEIYTYGGIAYYILDKEGNYKNISIDGLIADTVHVSKTSDSAETLMIWYFQDLEGGNSISGTGSTSRSITYKALANSARFGETTTDENGSTVTRRSLSNETWLGGHQTHRLYASLYGETEQLQFVKSIVEDPDSLYEHLIDHSLIKDGDTVLYKMIIKNSGKKPATISGKRIWDKLPSTSGVFSWSKDNVQEIYYVTDGLGSNVETVGGEYWDVDANHPLTNEDTSSAGQYYIHWKPGFKLTLEAKGEAWIYVKLKFPSSKDEGSNQWDNYIAQNNGSLLTNYFYIDQAESHVTHELVDVVEGIMQKGVLDTGLSTSGRFQSEDTRHYYQNGGNTDNGSVQETGYYTVIYNSGNVRLYLDPLRDQLPKGFKFRGLINAIPKAAESQSGFKPPTSSSYYNTLGSYSDLPTLQNTEYLTGNSSYIPVATVTDADRTDITYKKAYISAATETDAAGHQQVTFSISRGSYGDVRYDSELQKYYLDPGEAIRFGYMCTVEGFANTENVANNEIAMPVYDKYGLGINISDGEKVQILPAVYRDIAVNDGECELMTTEEETVGRSHVKSAWVRGTTDWFSSNVSLERLTPVPGVLKSVGGETYIQPTQTISPDEVYGSKYSDGSKTGTPYTGTVARSSIVNWLIRVYNEGGIGSNSMEDFTIVDTVEAPYMFTGNFFYDYYNVNGTKMSSSSVPVFSLGGRSENDTTVKISTGSGTDTMTLDGTITVNGNSVPVDGGRATVRLLRDEDGEETLEIRLLDNYHRIPPNSFMALVGHTQYVSSDAVLSKQFYNHVQLEPSVEFDAALVSQGKVLYKTEDEEEIPYAIESGASVTMTAGFTSAARKQVTQLGYATNTGWSDKDNNCIMLPDKTSKFYYDLYVDLPKDDRTKKLVLIDDLPEKGDHSPFVERDTRESAFTVHISGENPGFKVWSSPDLGSGEKKQLTEDQYTLQVTTRNEFTAEDWEGNGVDWTTIHLTDEISPEEEALLKSARSFRIIIDDADLLEKPDEALMDKNYQVQVRFNGELQSPDDADPGTIAWNSFGYRYTVPIGETGISTSLNAEPLKVGVQIPAVPHIIKDQKTPHNNYKALDTESTYRFLIYKGTALEELNHPEDLDDAQIAQILSTHSLDYMVASINIGSGQSTGQTPYLDEERKWTFTDGEFQRTAEAWIWDDGAKYTVLELPWTENGFEFSDIQHSHVNNYTFTQTTGHTITLRVTNVYKKKGTLKLQKTVTGPSFDEDRKFTFTIQLKDGRHPAFGTYHYTGTNIHDGSLTFDDTGTASIQLKHGQAIELLDLPADYTYSITESDDPWYSGASENAEGSIQSNQTTVASFVNTRKETQLKITKIVTGNLGNRYQEFGFEVYITDGGRDFSGSYLLEITKANGSLDDSQLHFEEGAAKFRLRHGESAIISGLPVGARYEVDELPDSRTGYEQTATNKEGVLTEEMITSKWENKKGLAIPTRIPFRSGIVLGSVLAIAAAAVFWMLRKRR